MPEHVSIPVLLFIVGVIVLFVSLIFILDKISEKLKDYFSSIEWEWVMILIIGSFYAAGWIITRPINWLYEYTKNLFKFFFFGIEVTVLGKVTSINSDKVDIPDIVDNNSFLTTSHEVSFFVLKVLEQNSNKEIFINIYPDDKLLNEEDIEIDSLYKFTCIKHWSDENLIFSSKKILY